MKHHLRQFLAYASRDKSFLCPVLPVWFLACYGIGRAIRWLAGAIQ